MNFLFEFFPLILFLSAYLYKDIYFALVVLMIAMPIGLAVKYFRTGTIDKMYLWSTVFLLVAGGFTLYFRNPLFLYWKPTVFYWVAATAFLGSRFFSKTTLVQRFFGLDSQAGCRSAEQGLQKTLLLSRRHLLDWLQRQQR